MTIDGGTVALLSTALAVVLLLSRIIGQLVTWKMEDQRAKRRGDGTDRYERRPCVPPEVVKKIDDIHEIVHAFDGDGRPRIWTPGELLALQRQLVDMQQQIVSTQQQQAQILDRIERKGSIP